MVRLPDNHHQGRTASASLEQHAQLGGEDLHRTHRVFPKIMDRVRLAEPVSVRVGPASSPSEFDNPEDFAHTCWGAIYSIHRQCRAGLEDIPFQ